MAISGKNQEGLSVRDVLTVVFKRKRIIVTFALTVIVFVVSVTLLLPRRYEVTASLLVNEARAEVPLAPTESQQIVVRQVSEEDINSEIEVLKSTALVGDIVVTLAKNEPIRLENVASPIQIFVAKVLPGEGFAVNEIAAEHLVNSIGVSAVRKSNVIRIGYQSTDPQWAARVVDTMIDRYLIGRAERYQSPQAVSFFQQQMRDAEKRLDESEAALEKFVNDASITIVDGPDRADSTGAQKTLVMARLSDLESSLGDAEVEQDAQLQEVISLRQKLALEPERLLSSNRMNQDAAVEEITRALAAFRLERDALLQDFKSDSRFVRDIDARIEMAEQQLALLQRDGNVSGTEVNPVHQQLKSELLRAEADLEGTRSRVLSLRTQVAQYRRVLDELNEMAFVLEGLRRKAKSAEEDYLLYRKKHEEARISAEMDRERFINVTVAQPAQVPLKPVRRGLLLKLILAVFLGFFGAVGLAFAIDTYFDRTCTTGEDIERRLGIPHLASIPDSVQMG